MSRQSFSWGASAGGQSTVGDFARFDFTEVDRTVVSVGYEIPF
jgi:hypothetical protein